MADLVELPASAHTGTTVRFRPDPQLVAAGSIDPGPYSEFLWLTVSCILTCDAW